MSDNFNNADVIKDIYLCDDNIEGIFTAIYQAWAAGTSHTDVRCKKDNDNYSLFENYIDVSTDDNLCNKVYESIKSKLGTDIYDIVYTVANSCAADKTTVIYNSLQKLFKYGPSYINNLSDKYIYLLFAIDRKVSNEAHFYREIIRFSENHDGILVARISPDNNIISLIADHFADRLHCENFIIYDTSRNISYIHSDNNNSFYYDDLDNQLYSIINSYSESDIQYQKLWKKFYETIAIKERTNRKLQLNMLPLKYRRYLPEM